MNIYLGEEFFSGYVFKVLVLVTGTLTVRSVQVTKPYLHLILSLPCQELHAYPVDMLEELSKKKIVIFNNRRQKQETYKLAHKRGSTFPTKWEQMFLVSYLYASFIKKCQS
jgi:hypothetical protein